MAELDILVPNPTAIHPNLSIANLLTSWSDANAKTTEVSTTRDAVEGPANLGTSTLLGSVDTS